MEKEFLTVGELASLMGTTVRTLQYYDQEGLLKPTAKSEGGRRLYSSKDVVKLHQILSFKYLGFSLEEIRNRLFTLDTPQEVAAALEQQKRAIQEEIANLQEALQAVHKLQAEVLAGQEVNFTSYAEIIEFLKTGNQGYWVWTHMKEPLREHIRERFGNDAEAGLKIYEAYQEMLEEAVILKRSGETADSLKSQELAGRWWNMILEFTGGDLNLLPQMADFNKAKENWNNEMAEKHKEVDEFMNAALSCYLEGAFGEDLEKHMNRTDEA